MLKTKEFKHNPIEKCYLCNKDILMDKDDWNTIIDYRGKDQRALKFYHNVCLKDLVEGKGKIIEQNFKEKVNLMVKNLMGKVPQPMNQTYELK